MAAPAGAAPTVVFGAQPVGTTGQATAIPLGLRTNLGSLAPATIVYNGGDPFLTAGLALSGLFVPVSAGALFNTFGDASLVSVVSGVAVNNGSASDFLVTPGDCVGSVAPGCTASGRFRPKAVGLRTDTTHPVFTSVTVTGAGWDPNLEGAIGPYFVPVLEQFDGIGLQGTGLVGSAIVLSPMSGPVGTPLNVVGSVFPAGDTVAVKYRTGLASPSTVGVCAATVHPDGTFSRAGTIPTVHRGAAGPHVVSAKSSPSAEKAKATFTLS